MACTSFMRQFCVYLSFVKFFANSNNVFVSTLQILSFKTTTVASSSINQDSPQNSSPRNLLLALVLVSMLVRVVHKEQGCIIAPMLLDTWFLAQVTGRLQVSAVFTSHLSLLDIICWFSNTCSLLVSARFLLY